MQELQIIQTDHLSFTLRRPQQRNDNGRNLPKRPAKTRCRPYLRSLRATESRITTIKALKNQNKNGGMWAAAIKPGPGGLTSKEGDFAEPGPAILEFLSDEGNLKETVAHKSSINDYSIEELQTLLAKTEEPPPRL